MIDIVLFWIWLGGATAWPDRKVGFGKRLFWPILLGGYLAGMAWDGGDDA